MHATFASIIWMGSKRGAPSGKWQRLERENLLQSCETRASTLAAPPFASGAERLCRQTHPVGPKARYAFQVVPQH